MDLEEIDDVSVREEGVGFKEVDDGVDPLECMCSGVALVLATLRHC